MRTVITILLATFLINVATVAVAQTGKQNAWTSTTASYSNGDVSYGAELGLAFEKTWLSASYKYAPIGKGHFVGINAYYRLLKDNRASFYVLNSFNMLTNDRSIYYEPGGTFCYDLSKRISPLFTVSLPVQPHPSLCYSLSIMYNFK